MGNDGKTSINSTAPLVPDLILDEKQKRRRLRNGESLEFNAPQGKDEELDRSDPERTISASWLIELIDKDSYVVRRPIKIANAIIKGRLSLRYALFPYELSITNSIFTDEVDMSFTTFKRVITFEGTVFDKPISFRSAHAESRLYFSFCTLTGNSNFVDLRVDENLYAERASFSNVDFTRARIGKAAFFRPYDAKYSLPFSQPRLKNYGKPVSFDGDAFFDDASFGGTIEFRAAQFNGESRFEGTRVGGSAFFYPYMGIPVRFHKKVRFCYAIIAENADFGSAQFMGDADFECMQVGAHASWDPYIKENVEFRDEEDLAEGGINQSQLENHTLLHPEKYDCASRFSGRASFLRARFKGPVSFRCAVFEKGGIFDGAEIQGPAEFQGAVFEGPAGFREARFRALLFRNDLTETIPFYKQFVDIVHLRGCVYDFINVAWPELFDPKHVGNKIKRSVYHRQPYKQLEKTLRVMGLDREADNVYLARRKREAQQLWERVFRRNRGEKISVWQMSQDLLSALFDFFQRLLFNYGVRPFRLLWLSLIVLIIGTYMFAQTDAIKHSEKEERNAVEKLSLSQAFGFSLRLFIPIVELPTGRQWVPTDKPAPYLHFLNLSFAGYATLHRLAGTILVPLGVAALTGFMHRHTRSE